MANIGKVNQSNGIFTILTHVKGNLWVVEQYSREMKLLHRLQGSEDEARADYDRKVATVAAEAALLREPLSTKELIK